MKQITKKEFTEAIIHGDQSVILQGIEEGIDLSIVSKEQEDGRRPPIEFASWHNDYGVLHILWKHQALATTPYIEDIFEKFKNGILPDKLYENDNLEELKKLKKVKLDLTDNFSASKLALKKIKISADKNGSEIIIAFKPFKFNNEVFEETIEFATNDILAIKPNYELTFTNEEDMGGSFYFDDVHNPVDLKRITFGKKIEKKTEVELELFFNFEHEGTPFKNELIIVKGKI